MDEQKESIEFQGKKLEERCTQLSKMISNDPIAAAIFLENKPEGYLQNTDAAYIALAHSVMNKYGNKDNKENTLNLAFQSAAKKYMGQKLQSD